MNNLDKDTLVNIIAALGAQATKAPGLQEESDKYYKWWREERETNKKLRQQLTDNNIESEV
jgi:hypothetical protein